MATHDEFRNITAFIGIMWVGILCAALLLDYICDNCAAEREEKIETPRGAKRKRARTDHTLATTMSSKYYSIYNVSRGAWAQNLSGGDDAAAVCSDNDWNEGEALVGFWLDDEKEEYTVIYCPAGHVIYVSADADGDESVYHLEESTYHVPIAILVNLGNQFDTKFLRRKGEPNWWGHGSASDCEPESESESESEEELPAKKRARLSHQLKQPSAPAGDRRIVAAVAANQPIVDFLYRCHDATTNTFKRKAYARVLAIIGSYWADNLTEASEYDLPRLLPALSENMIRKIREFIDGVPEEDIVNS